MTIYRMDGGSVVNTDRAKQAWKEGTRWDGSVHISLATGSQWEHQSLHKSRKGRYYVERTSQQEGATPGAEWLSNRAAAIWLLTNEHVLPEDLEPLLDEIEE